MQEDFLEVGLCDSIFLDLIISFHFLEQAIRCGVFEHCRFNGDDHFIVLLIFDLNDALQFVLQHIFHGLLLLWEVFYCDPISFAILHFEFI